MRHDPEMERRISAAFNEFALAVIQLMDAAKSPGLGGGRITDAAKDFGVVATRIYRSICEDAPK